MRQRQPVKGQPHQSQSGKSRKKETDLQTKMAATPETARKSRVPGKNHSSSPPFEPRFPRFCADGSVCSITEKKRQHWAQRQEWNNADFARQITRRANSKARATTNGQPECGFARQPAKLHTAMHRAQKRPKSWHKSWHKSQKKPELAPSWHRPKRQGVFAQRHDL
ncbi:hypothetical protein GJQ54_11040 [Oceanospirillaceae bacterium ASx5O]|nr:hypothetical protein GJQ54_11040 [Oceanospirillaceae bacterium ASx5O]